MKKIVTISIAAAVVIGFGFAFAILSDDAYLPQKVEEISKKGSEPGRYTVAFSESMSMGNP